MAGIVDIYDLSTGMPTMAPPVQLDDPGLGSSIAFGTIGGNAVPRARTYRAVVEGVVSRRGRGPPGRPDGRLDQRSSTSLILNDDQPQDNETFGQAIEIMHFNDDDIFVIAGNNELFSYYETLKLYPDARK